jgi:fatty acid desaturase
MAAATAGLENVIAGHLKRIVYVGQGRVVASDAVGALSALAWFSGGQAQLVVAGAIVVLIGIVRVQMIDGYRDIEGPSSADSGWPTNPKRGAHYDIQPNQRSGNSVATCGS